MPDTESNTPKAEGHTASQPSFFSLRRTTDARKLELTGTERTLALLEAERAELFNASPLFVMLGMFLTFPITGSLLTVTLSAQSLFTMLVVGVVWAAIMLGLCVATGVYFRWSRRCLLKRRVLLPAPDARKLYKNVRTWSIILPAAFLVLGPLSLLFTTEQWDRALLNALMFVPVGGVVLIYLGLFSARGDKPRCASCAYDVGDDPEDWITCPECGRDLAEPFGVVLGDRTRRPWMVGLGVAIIWAAHLGVLML